MMVRLAGWLGCTEGQAYTILIALTLSLSMAALGLPPTLEPRVGGPLAAPGAGPEGAPTSGPAAPEAPPGDGDAAAGDDAPLDLPGSTPVDGGAIPQTATGSPADGGGPTGGGVDGGGGPTAPPAPAAPPPAEGLDELEGADGAGAAGVFAPVDGPGAPHGLAVSSDGAVHVATDNAAGRGEAGPPTITRYDAEGRPEASLQLEDTDPRGVYGVLGLAIDGDDRLVAVDPAGARVLEVDLDAGEVATYAEIPDLPPCMLVLDTGPCEPGGVDQEPLPRDAVFDADGTLFVSDAGQGTIWRIEPDGAPTVWHQAEDYALRRPPDGGLGGLAVDRHGDLLAVVTTSFADGAFGRGILYRVAVSSRGAAGSRVEVVRTDPGDEPVGVVAGESGRIYLPLAAVDELVVLEEDGSEAERIGAAEVAEQTGIPLDAPTDVAFHGQTLLVTNKSAVRNEVGHWAVLGLAVGDAAPDRDAASDPGAGS
jgi:hypothetical protein